MTAPAKRNTQIICQTCRTKFKRGCGMRKTRRFCNRACYLMDRRKDIDGSAYPQIWYKGRREYLHRVIYMEHHGIELTPKQIIHHIDGNPRNRAIENLELLDDQVAHIHRHNYHRKRREVQKEIQKD